MTLRLLGGVTARSYITVLEEGLLAFLDKLGERKDFLFMQDNALIYGAHIVRDWFEKQGIQVMEWPPYSPDLNPIVNICAVRKRKLYKWYLELEEMASGKEAVQEAIAPAGILSIRIWNWFFYIQAFILYLINPD